MAEHQRFLVNHETWEYLHYLRVRRFHQQITPKSLYRFAIAKGIMELPAEYEVPKLPGKKMAIRIETFDHPILEAAVREKMNIPILEQVAKKEWYLKAMEFGIELLRQEEGNAPLIWDYIGEAPIGKQPQKLVTSSNVPAINWTIGVTEDKIPVTIHFNNHQTNQHVAICGKSNSGKTQLGMELTVQTKEQSPLTNIIFLDFAKGDVAANDEYIKAIGAEVCKVDEEGLPFNPFSLSDTSDRSLEELKDCITCLQSQMGPKQSLRLFHYLQALYNLHGNQVDAEIVFRHMTHTYEEEGIAYDMLYELFHKLNVSQHLPRSGKESYKRLLDKTFVLDLHKIQGHMKIKELLAFFVLQRLYQEALELPDAMFDEATGSREIRTIVVIDEAHAYLNTKHPVLEKMIRELRSRGVAIFLLSQGYGDLEQEFDYSSQMNFTFLLKSDNQRASLEKALAVGRHVASDLVTELAHAKMGRVYTRSLSLADKDFTMFDGNLFFYRNKV
ncbi:hypothetical protein [Priestia sp. TGN 0903]|uniref:hypothetical protein n=1 Tax=Priestia sp. TGN 0903 TaxID=3420730 RepID=UPI003D76D180